MLVAYLVGIPDKRAHQALLQGFQPDDVLAARQHGAADCDHVHAANGFADHS